MAAIDLGTNSIRLLVGRSGAAKALLGELARDMVITRLGQGVDRTGPDRARPLAADRRGAASATAAARGRWAPSASASPPPAPCATRRTVTSWPKPSSACTGEPMEVLSGAEEARTTFLGATRGLGLGGSDAGAPYLVMDIGGGSTEFVLGRERTADAGSRPRSGAFG